jgi:hypothetical protein
MLVLQIGESSGATLVKGLYSLLPYPVNAGAIWGSAIGYTEWAYRCPRQNRARGSSLST